VFIELGSVYVVCHEEDFIYLLHVDSRMIYLLVDSRELLVHIESHSRRYKHIATAVSLEAAVFIMGGACVLRIS
jgi:hypothetical protein